MVTLCLSSWRFDFWEISRSFVRFFRNRLLVEASFVRFFGNPLLVSQKIGPRRLTSQKISCPRRPLASRKKIVVLAKHAKKRKQGSNDRSGHDNQLSKNRQNQSYPRVFLATPKFTTKNVQKPGFYIPIGWKTQFLCTNQSENPVSMYQWFQPTAVQLRLA